jgi:RimJ/RimL family protein N-acetyltransferase
MDRRFFEHPASGSGMGSSGERGLIRAEGEGAMAETIIETDRLRLRTWDAADAGPYMEHLNTPEVMVWLGEPMAADDFEEKIVARVNAAQAEHGHCFWAIERKSDGELLGFCGLKRVDASGTDLTGEFEIGWRLRADCWGQGYAKEAAEASLDHAFWIHGAERVVAFTVEQNVPSWGLMLRLGMERREDLDYIDPKYSAELNPTIVYTITRDQWTA